MSDLPDRSLRELMAAVVNGEATDAERAQLEQRLLASEAARDEYLDYLNLHSELRRRFFTAMDEGVVPLSSEELAEFRRAMAVELYPRVRRAWANTLLWAVSTLAVALLVAVLWQPWVDARVIATIRTLEGEATLVTAQGLRTVAVGDILRRGETLRVADEYSRVIMQYPDGTTVHLHSGAVVSSPANQSSRLELLNGSMEVAAAKQPPGRPLVFATKHSRYVVLGTRFRLYQEEEASRLELDEGKVRLERPASGEQLDVEAGSVVISGDDETPVEVLPLSTGTAELLHTLPRAGQSVAFAGDRLFTSNWESGLMQWRLSDFSLEHHIRRGADRNDGLALAADGRIVQVNRTGKVVAWPPGKDALVLPVSGKHMRSRAVSPDGTVLAFSSDEGTKVLQLDVGAQKLRELMVVPPTGKAWCLAFTNEGHKLAAGFWDGTVNIYAVPGGEVQFTRKLRHTPTHCDLSPDGKHLVVTSQRDGLLLIDVSTGEERLLWPPAANIIRYLRFADNGRRVLAGLNDRTARMWSVADGRQLLVVEAGHSPAGVAWSEEHQLLATAEGAVKVWRCVFDDATSEDK